MTSGEKYGQLLTGDEEDVVTIINGLEGQATTLINSVKEAQRWGLGFMAGSASALALAFVENGPVDQVSYEKVQFMSIASALAVGGVYQFIKEQRMRGQISKKFEIADQYRQGLDPAGLGLYDDALYYSTGREDDRED